MQDISEILIHWQSGRPLSEIARSLDVDRKTVRKYVGLAVGLGYQVGGAKVTAEEWSSVIRQSAPELIDSATRSRVFAEIAVFHEAIVGGLDSNCATTVWQRLHDEHGLQASLRSFRRYIDQYVPDRHRPQVTVLRDDPPPGQEAQIDFGYLGIWHDPTTGKRLRLWAFAMVLCYSRHMFVFVVTKLDQHSWIEAHVAAFTFFGGVPAFLVIDNLKPGVLQADLYDPKINRAYEELSRHYSTLIDPCRKGHPKDKPRIERPIPYIRDSFFAGRIFGSLKEINAAAEKWCLSVAGERIHGTTRQRPLQLFQQVEARSLRPLPKDPFEMAIWTRGKVAPDCHVQVKGRLYSVPYRYIGKTLDVRITHRAVEFHLDHTLVKTHLRSDQGRRQTDWSDYPEDKARFFQRTPDWCRAKAATFGPHVGEAVRLLLDQHALHYLRQAQGIIGLAEKYGPSRLDSACQRALAFDDASYQTVRNILRNGLEGQLALPLNTRVTAGAYLRGSQEFLVGGIETISAEENDG